MKKIKSLVCILLAVSMLFVLCACGGNVEGNVHHGDASENTENVDGNSDSNFDIGTVSGGKYENKFFGIGCAMDENWTFATEDQLLDMIGETADQIEDGDLKDSLMNANMFYDMQVASNDGYANINVVIENLGVMYGTIISEDEYVKQNVEQLPSALAQAGIDVNSCEATTVQFAGAERNAIQSSSVTQGVDLYQLQVIIKNGSYIAIVTISSYVSDITADIAAMFYVI